VTDTPAHLFQNFESQSPFQKLDQTTHIRDARASPPATRFGWSAKKRSPGATRLLDAAGRAAGPPRTLCGGERVAKGD
jgi:hypothetical protein